MIDYGADNPFKTLGWHLKFAREQLKQTLAEVSGAVEIDTETLAKIENGDQRPSEEILLLLISHLGLEDAEANSLWNLAGFDTQTPKSESTNHVAFAMPLDIRIIYTDLAHISVNKYGVVMNFMQAGGQGMQPLAVSRVGMSKSHARQVLNMLDKALNTNQLKPRPKMLHAPKKRSNRKQAS